MEHLYYKLEIDSSKELWKSLNSLPYECSIMNAHTYILFHWFPNSIPVLFENHTILHRHQQQYRYFEKGKKCDFELKVRTVIKTGNRTKASRKIFEQKKAHDHYECVLDLHYLRLAMNKYNRIIILSFSKTRRQFFFFLHSNDHGPSTRRTPSTRFWLTPYQVY